MRYRTILTLLFLFSTSSLYAQSDKDLGEFGLYESVENETEENPKGENSVSIGLKLEFQGGRKLSEEIWTKIHEADGKIFSFRDVKFTKEDRAHFQKLEEVKEISFTRCEGLKNLIPILPEMLMLERLSFVDCEYLSNEKSFSQIQGLKYLRLTKGWDLKELPTLDHVETLNLQGATVYDRDLALVAEKFPKLKKLTLANTFINGQNLDDLSALQIEELWLNCTPLYQPNLVNLKGFKSLRTLVLNQYMEGQQYIVSLDSILLVARLESLRNLFLMVPYEETQGKKEIKLGIEAAGALNSELVIHNIWEKTPKDF